MRFEHVDRRFEQVDRRFDRLEGALVEQRRYMECAFERAAAQMDARFTAQDAKMNAGFARIERKLDQFIDTQSKTNELVERRLGRLESHTGLG